MNDYDTQNDRQSLDDPGAALTSCRFRVAIGPAGRHLCRHPAVRARDCVVTESTCFGCGLQSTIVDPRPLPAEQLMSVYDAAVDVWSAGRNAAEPAVRNATEPAVRRATEGDPYRGGGGQERVRVGFVTPNLVMGGAERWIVNLLRYLDRSRILPSGIVLLNAAPADPAMCAEAAEFAPLFGGPDGVARSGDRPQQGGDRPREGGQQSPTATDISPPRSVGATLSGASLPGSPAVTRFASAQEALEVLCRRSDVIVAWGSSHFARLMAQCHFAGEVVIVAHGSAPGTVRMLDGGKGAAQHLVGVSKAAAAAFRDPRAAVLHNGADTTRCAVTLPREETRRRWGAEPCDVLLGYVGRFSWEKNPLAAAPAARALNGGHRDVSLARRARHGGPALASSLVPPYAYRAVYIGGGAHEDEVRAQARAMAPKSIFVPPVEQIGDALAALDVFMLASPSEGFSLALTEAWLCGVPAVATRVGAVPELEASAARRKRFSRQIARRPPFGDTSVDAFNRVEWAGARSSQPVRGYPKAQLWGCRGRIGVFE